MDVKMMMMFIEPMITRVPLGLSGVHYSSIQNFCLKKKQKMFAFENRLQT